MNIFCAFSQDDSEELNIIKDKINQISKSYNIAKKTINLESLDEIIKCLHKIFIEKNDFNFIFPKISASNETGECNKVTIIDTNNNTIGDFIFWFGTTHIPDSFTYFEGTVYIKNRKYYVFLYDDEETIRYGGKRDETHYLLGLSYIDQNTEFAYFNTFFTDNSIILKTRKHKNVEYFLELPTRIEDIIMWRQHE
jgi:hypothetical protein